MVQIDWTAVVERLLRKHPEGLPYSKAVKKAVKRVHSQQEQLDPHALKKGVKAFLTRGSGFIVQDGLVARAAAQPASHKGHRPAESLPLSGGTYRTNAAAQTLAALGEQPHKASKKRKHAAAEGQHLAAAPAGPGIAEQPAAALGQPGPQAAGGQKKRKKERAKESMGQGLQEQQQEQQQQRQPKGLAEAPGQGAQQQQQQEKQQGKAGKTSKKRKIEAAEAAAAAVPAAAAEAVPAAAAAEAGKPSQKTAADEARAGKKLKKSKKGSKHAPEEAGGAAVGQHGQQGSAPSATKVLPPGAESDVKRWREVNKRQNVKSGPFSQAEKDTLRQAVLEYAELHGHSKEDFSWLFERTKKRVKRDQGAWAVIGEALPLRTYKSVWGAGTRMFHPGNYQGRFSVDDDARLAQLVAERGHKWKEIGAALGRMPDSCKDRWREISLGSERNTGRWSDEETLKLKEVVEEYLNLARAAQQPDARPAQGELQVALSTPGAADSTARPLFEEEGASAGAAAGGAGPAGGGTHFSLRRQVLDDIDWGVVSKKMGTRSNVQCLEKWYSQLCPSMVERGDWGAGDDRRLLRAIYNSGAAQDFELDWDSLVPGRTAQQARRRWRLMVKCVAGARNKDFGEIVEYLVERYMPQLKQQTEQQTPAAAAGTGQ